MAIPLNDNPRISAPKPTDDRTGPYADVASALAAIPSSERHELMEVIIGAAGSRQKYVFSGGIADGDLVLSGLATGSGVNGAFPDQVLYADLNGNLAGSDSLLFDGDGLSLDGDFSLFTGEAFFGGSAFNVTSDASFNGAVLMTAGLDVNNGMGVTGGLTVNGGLGVTGGLTVENGLGNLGGLTSDFITVGANGHLAIQDLATAPPTPASGGIAYSEAGRLKWVRADGTVDTLGEPVGISGFENSDISFIALTPGPTVTIDAQGRTVLKRSLAIDQDTVIAVSNWASGAFLVMTVTNGTAGTVTLTLPSGHYPKDDLLGNVISLVPADTWVLSCFFDGSAYEWNYYRRPATTFI